MRLNKGGRGKKSRVRANVLAKKVTADNSPSKWLWSNYLGTVSVMVSDADRPSEEANILN